MNPQTLSRGFRKVLEGKYSEMKRVNKQKKICSFYFAGGRHVTESRDVRIPGRIWKYDCGQAAHGSHW